MTITFTTNPIQATTAPVLPARQSLRRKLLSGGLWVVGARFCGIGSMVLGNAVLARQLLPEAFGDFVLLSSLINAGSLVAIFGMNTGIVRFVSEELAHEHRSTARQILLKCRNLARCATAIAATIVFLGVLIAGRHFLDSTSLFLISALTALALAMQAHGNLNSAALRAMGEMRYSSILGGQGGVVGPLANTCFLIVMSATVYFNGLSLDSALTAYVAAFGMTLLIGNWWVHRTVRRVLMVPIEHDSLSAVAPAASAQITTYDTRTIFAACFPMLIVQVLSTVSKQGGLWVAGMTISPHDLALYAAASRSINFVAMPLSLVNLSVMAFIPQLRAQNRLPELERILRVSAGWAAIPSFLALLTFLLMPSLFLQLFLGNRYENAGELLSILSIGQFVFVWSGLAELTLVLSGRAREAACVNLVSAVIILAVGPMAAHYFGVTGLAALASSVVAIQCVAQWLTARRLVGIWTHATLFPTRIGKVKIDPQP